MKLLIKGGRVINPSSGQDEVIDILVEDGIIQEISKDIQVEKDVNIVDAVNKLVCPGFIDLHVHLREPGFEYKEDIASGTRAAAAGGFTSICCMPNTDPVIDNAAVASFVKERAAKSGVVNVYPIGAVTRQQAGKELAEIAELVTAGCVGLSDDGKPVLGSDIMRHAMDYANMFNLPILSHCEDTGLSSGGQMNEGYYSTIYGLQGIPDEAEEVMVARDIMLAGLTGARLHLCHLSTARSIDLVRLAKKKGLYVTCEVTPHHLTLTDEIIEGYDTDAKVNPPLRTAEDIEALIAGINDGTVDCIATDHAPHHLESKDCEFNLAAFGISGLETAIPVVMSLVNKGRIDLMRMVELFTVGPADIINIDRGTIEVGAIADITIIDPDKIKTVKPQEFYSKGKNTPYKNKEFRGWPYATIVNGELAASEGIVR